LTPKLYLQAFTLKTVPGRLGKLKQDLWAGFEEARRSLPAAPKREAKVKVQPAGKSVIVTAKPPKPRAKRS
jgi:hypothetical protein